MRDGLSAAVGSFGGSGEFGDLRYGQTCEEAGGPGESGTCGDYAGRCAFKCAGDAASSFATTGYKEAVTDFCRAEMAAKSFD